MRGGVTGYGEALLGAARQYWVRGGGEGCGEAVLGQGGLVLATRSVGGSDMIPSHASSGMALALMHAIKGGDQEAAGRCCLLVRSQLVSFTRRSSECRGLKFGARRHGAEGTERCHTGGSLLPRALRVRAES